MTNETIADCENLKTDAAKKFRAYQDKMAAHVDYAMAGLLAVEWLLGIVAAVWLSPRTWSGVESRIHPHVWLALIGGLAIVCTPIALALLYPARIATRHVIAVAQMLMSALFIDITNGRIETHFHVFGSLAFLAFYRDWRVLITATVVTALDHIFRGIWLPQTIYGVLTASPWRWVEHACWVAFEDIVLIISCQRGIREMWTVATREAQLSYGAYHDVLTGLANRRLLSERFDRGLGKISQGEPGLGETDGGEKKGAILFIDLDRFKLVNDTLGHGIGDRLLVAVSQRLTSILHASDTIARVGGDEFVVVIEHLKCVADAERIGMNLLGVFREPFLIDEHELLLSASIGIGLYPDHGTQLTALQEVADIAMYEAKAEGRNRIACFSKEMTERVNLKIELERGLYDAIPRGEMEVYYQPQVNSTGEISGLEALLRWNHPVRGPIPPSEFIPMAEKAGLIVSLGKWVLQEACRECSGWQSAGYENVSVAVNVSATQLEEAGFAQDVLAIIEDAGIDPSLLTLELTESALLQNLKISSQQLAILRAARVLVALDDFGTGYSSLSYLQALPADIVKLDRTFVVREFENTPAVLRSVIELAHRLGLRVVGEGVETAQQGQRLRDMDCDELQGFYFSKAVPAGSVVGLLQSNRELELQAAKPVEQLCPVEI
jgi:diguanylate cyclase (GGDEF)-like protein